MYKLGASNSGSELVVCDPRLGGQAVYVGSYCFHQPFGTGAGHLQFSTPFV